jgi:hypothetical protein
MAGREWEFCVILPVYIITFQNSEEDLMFLLSSFTHLCFSEDYSFIGTEYTVLLSSALPSLNHWLLSPCRIFLISDIVQTSVFSNVAIIAHRLGHGYPVIVVLSWHQKFEVKYFKLIFNILKMLVLVIVDYCYHFKLSCNPVACQTTSKYIYMRVQCKLKVRLHKEDLATI